MTRLPEFANTTRVKESMFGGRPQPVIILPSRPGESGEIRTGQSAGTIAQLPADTPRLPEGYFLSSLKGRVEREGDWYVIQLEKTEKLGEHPPFRLLPNQRLEILEAMLAQPGSSTEFVVNGLITEFQNVNYLLLNNLMQLSPQHIEDKGEPNALDISEQESVTDVPSTAPTRVREPTAEEVADKLMRLKPLKAAVLPASKPATGDLFDSDDEENHSWKEDTILINRKGRVVRGEKGWMLVFENMGDTPQDKPIRILPSRLLESALIWSRGGTRSVVFVTSGKVNVYKGTRYLLLHKLLVRRDMGNFR
ncbi:MAG: hypothetical protein JSV03_11845 [Planctomycetota bacterium]|nr:MAG: hypothetical protein JSV03_11845 [Planctomycetota bacterium]